MSANVFRHGGVLLALALILTATGRGEGQPEGPQPPLPSVRLVVGKAPVQAEVADEPHERNIGLMARTNLAEGGGMLFVFPRPQPMSFWMHNTLVPLSIAYINAEGVIREIHDMEPLKETPVRSMFRDLLYALEVPQGWFARNGILAGDRVTGLPAPATAKPD
jgi:uncharacterized membrane protein (UPF0127 family)